MKNLRYRSRISVLLSLIILIIMLPTTLFPAFKSNTPILSISIFAFMLIFILSVFFSTRYIIKGENLIIKCLGIKMANININYIQSIKRSYNPLSSPAISLKRLSISFISENGPQYILLSPVKEREFINELKEINPNIISSIVDKNNVLRFWDWDI